MTKKRLSLRRETIRQLTERDLAAAAGGAPDSYWCDSFTDPIPSARCPTQRSLCTILSRCV